jgi:hypothetical protein
MGDPAQAEDRPQAWLLELGHQVSLAAGADLFCCRSICRREALDRIGDPNALKVAVFGEEANILETSTKPPRRGVADERYAGSVGPLLSGCEPDDQQGSIDRAGGRYRSIVPARLLLPQSPKAGR